jgi:hypothetical protein
MFITLIKNLFFLLSVSIGAFASLILLFPVVLLIPLHSLTIITLRRRWSNYVAGQYFDFVASMIGLMGDCNIYIYSNDDNILKDNGVIMISNHPTKMDWIFAGWVYSNIANRNSELKFIVRDSLRSIPIFGWVCNALIR